MSFFIWLLLLLLLETAGGATGMGAAALLLSTVASSGTVASSEVNSMPLPLSIGMLYEAILACWIWMFLSRLSPTRGNPDVSDGPDSSDTDFFFSRHCFAFAARSFLRAFSTLSSF